MKLKKLTIQACLLAALGAGVAVPPPAYADGPKTELTVHAKRYQQYFNEAANEFNVPVALLESIAYAETRWHPHVPKGKARKNGEPEVEVDVHDGMPPAYGIMGLRDDNYFGHSLSQGAALIRVTPAQAASDTRTNIRAAAALLSQLGARKTSAFPLEDWEDAVAKYSGIPQREIAQLYTYEILTAIRQGRESGEFKVSQKHVEMEKVYGKDKLRKLSARRITVETGVPDPKISVPDFVDTPAKNK
jgi:soluble lytic murein transglycosylase-like protein